MLYIVGSELSESNGRREIWIHIIIERIVIVKIHFTIYKKEKQTNKQAKREKENKPMLGLT